ncbi:MAG: biotin transporter BioY [Chloroflexi bacterium]|nr:biotin transporter BioY [Chloroflexota bacterium]
MTIALPRLERVPPDERGITIGDFLVPIRIWERIGVRARHIALIVAGALLIALSANLYIPLSPIPITGQTFAVLLVGGALGFRRGIASTLLYLVIGFWFPVYAQRESGVETILSVQGGSLVLGVSGGYLVGFVAAAALVGRLAELGWDRRLVGSVAAMLLGNVVIYLIGLPWLQAATGMSWAMTIQEGLTPFVIGDALKLLLAAVAFPAAWWIVGRRPGDR